MPKGWRGPRYIDVSISTIQTFMLRFGGARERSAPVARLRNDVVNILGVFAADGSHLGSIGWRPHDARYAKSEGLFICG